MRDLEQRTGVNRERIRVFLRLGLIPQPERKFRNVADYDESHVTAVLAVRKLQQQNRLTLPQISALLNGTKTDTGVEAGAFGQLEKLYNALAGANGPPVSIESLEDHYPKAAEDAEILERMGILEILHTPSGGALSITDAQLIRIWGDMRAGGFAESLEFGPNILGHYLEAADYTGQWMAAQFLERLEGRVDVKTAATMVEHALPLMLNFFGLLRTKAFFHYVEKFRENGGKPPRNLISKRRDNPSRAKRRRRPKPED